MIHPSLADGEYAAVGRMTGSSTVRIGMRAGEVIGRSEVERPRELRRINSEASLVLPPMAAAMLSSAQTGEIVPFSARTISLEEHKRTIQHLSAALDANTIAFETQKEAMSRELDFANEKIEDLKSDVFRLEAELDGANNQLQSLKQTSAQSAMAKTKFTTEKAELKKRIDELTHQLIIANSEIETARNNTQRITGTHKSLKRELNLFKSARDALQQRVTAQDGSLAHTQQQLTIAKSLIGVLNSKLSSVNDDNATLHGELQRIETLKVELANSRHVAQWMQRAVYVLAALVLAVVVNNVKLRQAGVDQ